MKLFFTRLAFFSIALIPFSFASAQQNFFTDVPEAAAVKSGEKRVIIPQKYRVLQLDTASMLPFLRSLPFETNIGDRNNTPVIALPMPDGSVARFNVWETPMFERPLPAGYPEIKTFTGQGIDDRTATIKLDWTALGFHAMVYSSATGNIFIDPYAQGSMLHYISYYRKDHQKKFRFEEKVLENELPGFESTRDPNQILAGPCVGTQLRTFRLAIACTGEYADAVSPGAISVPVVLSAMTTTMNRVNGVYETELSVRMVFVANQTKVIFTNAATDRFTANNDGFTLLDESQLVIGDSIGVANYDIGHTFSTGGGGVAALESVCVHQGGTVRGDLGWNYKARGITGSDTPTGDAYDIDFVAHEMGHQFGANHSFNNGGSCGTTASDQNGEPGSGVSIMGYAGVCANDNIAFNSIAFFHPVSFDKISPFVANGNGSSCDVATPTGNSIPVVNAGADYTIPRATPFILTGSATDANGDALTYDWEQVDVGGPNGASTSPSGNAPLFRSFAPVTTGERYFPKLSDVIGNVTTLGERLPSYARNMKFRLTARDNRAGGGGVCFDETNLTVTSDSFYVTFPTASGITWLANEFRTITWNPQGTAGAPINCANVMIQLSTNGGTSYPITLSASTANDGSEEIQVPGNLTSTARIRIMAVGNVFYDISNNNFRIQNSSTNTFVFNDPQPVVVCGNSGVATLKTAALGTFITAINLTASGVPAGTTVSFGSTSLTPGGNTTVTLNNAGSLAPGSYTITVTGIAGAVTKTKNIQFIVGNLAAPSLATPAAEATGIAVQPSFNWSALSGSLSYTLEISTANDFSANLQSLTGITSLPYALSSTLTENTTYYWRVRGLGNCGPGAISAVNRFKTGISSCQASTNVPRTITAIGTPTVTSTLVIPAEKGVIITDLNVINLTGSHTYVGDLTFSLRGPNNVTITLLDGACSGGFEDFNINLDDAGGAGVNCPMTTGQVTQPVGLLSTFNGINSAGTWTLSIRDNATDDGGSLTGWGLNINGATATGCSFVATPLATVYTFTGTGNWNVPANWSGGTVPPNPLPSGAAIIINHSNGGNCTLNISQTISAGATLTVNTGKNLIVPGSLTIQ